MLSVETSAQVQAPCPGLRWKVGRLRNSCCKHCEQEWRGSSVHCEWVLRQCDRGAGWFPGVCVTGTNHCFVTLNALILILTFKVYYHLHLLKKSVNYRYLWICVKALEKKCQVAMDLCNKVVSDIDLDVTLCKNNTESATTLMSIQYLIAVEYARKTLALHRAFLEP